MKVPYRLKEGAIMRKKISEKEMNKIYPYIDKLLAANESEAIESIAIADYSIGTNNLHLYVIFDKETAIPAGIEDIINEIGYQNLKGNPLGISIGIDYSDEAMPNNIQFLWKRGDKR